MASTFSACMLESMAGFFSCRGFVCSNGQLREKVYFSRKVFLYFDRCLRQMPQTSVLKALRLAESAQISISGSAGR
jgi:hypothetical protein